MTPLLLTGSGQRRRDAGASPL